MLSDLEEIKAQLEIADIELKETLERAISRRDSDTGSAHEPLTRQASNTSDSGSLRKRTTPERKGSESPLKVTPPPPPAQTNQKLIDTEKSETGSVKWDVYKHYLRSIGWTLSIATIILNMVFQSFSIGSNIWLSKWSSDTNAGNDTSLRDMYLGVYGAFGAGQGECLGSLVEY